MSITKSQKFSLKWITIQLASKWSYSTLYFFFSASFKLKDILVNKETSYP